MILLGIVIWIAAAFLLAVGFGKFARAGMGCEASASMFESEKTES